MGLQAQSELRHLLKNEFLNVNHFMEVLLPERWATAR